jgi:pimeloyl-ACP methyl ester carboxylesterase
MKQRGGSHGERRIQEKGRPLSKITPPALIINGENEFLAPPMLGRKIADAMPNAEFVEAKGASHPVHHEQVDWLVATITDCLGNR